MSIEDVKQWTDTRLDFELDKLLHPENNERMVPSYCSLFKPAREAQAKAMEASQDRYVSNLDYVVNPNAVFDVWINDDIAKLLQATPRQISEAAYLTLKGEQS